MKCRLLMPQDAVISHQHPGPWQCSECPAEGTDPPLTTCPQCGGRVNQRSAVLPAGTELEMQRAYVLVRLGVAEAADEECEAMVRRTPAQLQEARFEAVRRHKGIHPDDFKAYAAGIIDGYNPDGSFKPGPNWSEPEEDDDEDEYDVVDETED